MPSLVMNVKASLFLPFKLSHKELEKSNE